MCALVGVCLDRYGESCQKREPSCSSLSFAVQWLLVGPRRCLGSEAVGRPAQTPPMFPEVLFQCAPGRAGDLSCRFPDRRRRELHQCHRAGVYGDVAVQFCRSRTLDPPFREASRWSGGDQITVTVTVISGTGQTQVSDATQTGKATASVSCRRIRTHSATLTPSPEPNPEVRFDVCAPLPGESTVRQRSAESWHLRCPIHRIDRRPDHQPPNKRRQRRRSTFSKRRSRL